ncbi:MAG: hypothetical protein ABIH46_06610 [Chloroflexota bacterium]
MRATASHDALKASSATPFRLIFDAVLADPRDVLSRYQGSLGLLRSNPQFGSLASLRKILGDSSVRQQTSSASLANCETRSAGTAPAESSLTVQPRAGAVLALQDYPRPSGDNGRGIHWVPTTSCSKETVDRFVGEAADMKMKWAVFLNDGTKTGDNDYLVERLVANDIMPIMRIYTPPGAPLKGDIEGLVSHYTKKGVPYFQLFNEPNLTAENAGAPPDVQRYLDDWIPAAKRVAAAGGLPGLGALSPGGDMDDREFLRQAIEGIKARGEENILNGAWISMHNYSDAGTGNPGQDAGYLRFRDYDAIVRPRLGRSLPIIGTEGGNPPQQAAGAAHAKSVAQAYQYMTESEPYYFAYSYWIIANEEGGGHDPAFQKHALFQQGSVSPIVQALKNLS